MNDPQCLFCKISRKDLSANILFEDETLVAFHDIHPKAPTHVLVIPRKHIRSLAEAEGGDSDLLGKLLLGIQKAAELTGVNETGYRTIINTRHHGGQEVDHLHLHLLGGEALGPMRSLSA